MFSKLGDFTLILSKVKGKYCIAGCFPDFMQERSNYHPRYGVGKVRMEASDKLVTVATFMEATRAHVLKGKLEAEGISCMIADGNVIPYLPIFSDNQGVRVQVLEKDKEAALHIIQGLESDNI